MTQGPPKAVHLVWVRNSEFSIHIYAYMEVTLPLSIKLRVELVIYDIFRIQNLKLFQNRVYHFQPYSVDLIPFLLRTANQGRWLSLPVGCYSP